MLATATRISLETACDSAACSEFAWPLYRQLADGRYDVCSVLPLPESLVEWRSEHRTARKRADRCARLGYRFAVVRPERHVDDLYAINVSLGERQGRPMSAGYRERPSASPDPAYPCARHGVRRYGVLTGDTLVAYLWLYRAGDLALVSQILGHGEHLTDGVMFLLIQGAIEREIPHGGYLTYNRHDSGESGLRWWKERCGFAPIEVDWQA